MTNDGSKLSAFFKHNLTLSCFSVNQVTCNQEEFKKAVALTQNFDDIFAGEFFHF